MLTKMPKFLLSQFTIEDLVGGEVLEGKTALEKRRKVEILVIDDEEFTVGKKLTASNFHLNYRKDIENITDVSEYQIILCDIRGVGTKLNSTYEGAFIIKEIKLNYPTKRVVAYTGSNYDASYNDFLRYADEIVKKGLDAEDWMDILDEEIDKCLNPIYQWQKIRSKLLENGVSIISVAKLESAYVSAIKKKSFDNFSKLANNMDPQVNPFIRDLMSSAAVSYILKGVGL